MKTLLVINAVLMGAALCLGQPGEMTEEEESEVEIVPERYFALQQDKDHRLVAVLVRPANFSIYTDLNSAYKKHRSLSPAEAIASVAVKRQVFTERQVPALREWYKELLALSIPIKPKDTFVLDGPTCRLRLGQNMNDIMFRTAYVDHPLVLWARKVHGQLMRLAETRDGQHNE